MQSRSSTAVMVVVSGSSPFSIPQNAGAGSGSGESVLPIKEEYESIDVAGDAAAARRRCKLIAAVIILTALIIASVITALYATGTIGSSGSDTGSEWDGNGGITIDSNPSDAASIVIGRNCTAPALICSSTSNDPLCDVCDYRTSPQSHTTLHYTVLPSRAQSLSMHDTSTVVCCVLCCCMQIRHIRWVERWRRSWSVIRFELLVSSRHSLRAIQTRPKCGSLTICWRDVSQ